MDAASIPSLQVVVQEEDVARFPGDPTKFPVYRNATKFWDVTGKGDHVNRRLFTQGS